MNPKCLRRYPLDGCFNFRDLGGYPAENGYRLRWGLLFRSDSLHELSPSDLAILRDEIGIRDAIDLRSSREIASEHLGGLRGEPISVHHYPLFDGNTMDQGGSLRLLPLDETYLMILETAQNTIARVLTTIAHANHPLVFFCAAGKDRTGVISAIVQSLLGVPDEVIVEDYTLSQESMVGIIGRLKRMGGYESIFSLLPEHTLHARGETMSSFLTQAKERYGSFSSYLLHAGVSPSALTELRKRFLEEA